MSAALNVLLVLVIVVVLRRRMVARWRRYDQPLTLRQRLAANGLTLAVGLVALLWLAKGGSTK